MDNQPIAQDIINFGYLEVMSFENGQAFRGGCLIIDSKGFPIEFRLSSPVRPTELQKILYGKSMKEYIEVELISIPLISGMKERVVSFFVREESLLKARPLISYPLMFISQSGIVTHPQFSNEKQIFADFSKHFSKALLNEPFARVKEALNEAHIQKIGE